MKVKYWFSIQFGLLIDFGENYEKRKYMCLELPFLTLQIFWLKPKTGV